MKTIGQRFTWKFIGYFLLFYLLINASLVLLLFYSAYHFDGEVMSGNPAFETSEDMQSLVHIDGKKITISNGLAKSLKKNQSILLIRDRDHHTVKKFNAHEKVHNLSWYYAQDLTTWSLTPEYEAVLIDRQPIVKAAELFDLRETEKLKRFMDANDLSLFSQSIDKDDLQKVYGSFSVEQVKKSWFQDKNGDNYNQYIFRETMRDSKYYLFAADNPNKRDKSILFDENGMFKDKEFMNELKNIGVWYLMFSAFIFFVILMLALLVGHRMTRPLIHFVRWLEQLQQGHYAMPTNDKIYRKGQLKRKYRMYHSVDSSIQDLTDKLKSDQAYQERVSQLRDEWIAGITHDLKTPLSSIYGYSKLLTSDLDISCEERQKFAHIIEDKALYIDSLLKDLNMTYQMKNNILEFNKGAVDIVDYIEHFIEHFNQPQLYFLNKTHAQIKIDKERMDRVMTNIVSNAFIHNDEVEVWINTVVEENMLVIEIADNGKGIPKEELPYIFNRYYRGKGVDKESGSGLGLAVAKQIIENHGGEITVDSTIAGTRFFIRLPVKNS